MKIRKEKKIKFFFLFFFIETKKIDIMNMEVRVVIMDSKLELFLSKLNLPKEDYNYLLYHLYLRKLKVIKR